MSKNNTNNSITMALTNLGLNENEANLYEILLKIPEANIRDLVEHSQFPRTLIYYILEGLKKLELVAEHKKGKKTMYVAEPPEKLEALILSEEKEIKRQKNLLADVLSDLRSFYRLGHNKPGVRFYEGFDGLREALFDSLSAKETIYTYMDRESMKEVMYEINKTYLKKRLEKSIKKKLLLVDSAAAREYIQRNKNDNNTLVRLLPSDTRPFKTGMQIYDNKIVYFTHRKENTLAVIIEDSDLYSMHRSLFDAFWKILNTKNVVVNNNGSKTVFN